MEQSRESRFRDSSGKLNILGERLRQRRQAMKLTQDAVGARITVKTEGAWNAGRREILRIENGTRSVSDLEILALADALECDPCWLLRGDRDSESQASPTPPTATS